MNEKINIPELERLLTEHAKTVVAWLAAWPPSYPPPSPPDHLTIPLVKAAPALLAVVKAATTIFGYIEPELKDGASVRRLAEALDALDFEKRQ